MAKSDFIMKIRNTIYYTSYKHLERNDISFADYSKGKSFYTQLAPFFDSVNSRESHTVEEANFLVSIARQYSNHEPNSFLDIACGTGRHIKELAEKGYQTFGIDSSKELLTIARKAVPSATFVHDDMRTFNIAKTVDCAYSFWDSYVYLSRPKDMTAFAKRCSAHIKQGGILVLDSKNYLRKQPDKLMTHRVGHVGDFRIDLIIRREAFLDDKVYEAVFTSIIQNTSTDEAHVVVDQTLARIYGIADLEKSLQGFKLVKCYGDLQASSEFDVQTSERLIAVFQKDERPGVK